MQGLPPLNALRAFEAAARRHSFKLAAAELNVTPAAVSQQIRQLEELLGVQLFDRSSRRVELTPAGVAGLEKLSQGFSLFSDAVAAIRKPASKSRLSILCPAAFGLYWLSARLPDFRRLYPDIDLLVSTTQPSAQPNSEPPDIEIFYAAEPPQTPGATSLHQEYISPVCAPDYINKNPLPISSTADLATLTLLKDTSIEALSDGASWKSWFNARSAFGLESDSFIQFTDAALAIQTALAGGGVILGRRLLTQDLLAAQRLNPIFPDGSQKLNAWYGVVMSQFPHVSPEAELFKNWLKTELSLFEDSLDQL